MADYLLVDVETGGLDPYRHALLEIGAVALDSGLKVRTNKKGIPVTFETKVCPCGGVVEEAAVEVNGHRWALNPRSTEYRTAPNSATARVAFNRWLEQHYGVAPSYVVLVGWNVGFDKGFLERLYRHGTANCPFHYHVLDLLGVARYLDALQGKIRKSYALQAIAGELGVKPRGQAHTALADALLALDVVNTLQKTCEVAR